MKKSSFYSLSRLPLFLLLVPVFGLFAGLRARPEAAVPVTYRNVSSTHLPLAALTGNSMDARPADLDADGDLDLVVACEFCPNTILINDGTGRFTDESAARMAQPSHDSEDIAVADFDADGDLDIVFVAEDDQINEFYLNDGTGTFTDASARLAVTGTSNAVLSPDINGDGFADLLIGNAGQNVALINDSTGHFADETTQRIPANFNTTQDLEWGDVDGDGDGDLVEGNENGNRLLINDGAGFFTDETATRLPLPAAGEETREADLGDVDGDGDLDLFLANVTFGQGRPAQNRLLLNDGNGFFSDVTAANLPAEQRNTVDGDFVDLDYDGDLDLVAAQAFDSSFRIYLNDGSGRFADSTGVVFQTLPTGSGIDIEAADFTGDGLLDLYLTGFRRTDLLYVGEGIIDTGNEPPDEPDFGAFRLDGNAPNPFSRTTHITYMLHTPAFVELRVYDLAGREVATAIRRHQPPGAYTYPFLADHLAAGLYLYTVHAGPLQATRPMVVVR